MYIVILDDERDLDFVLPREMKYKAAAIIQIGENEKVHKDRRTGNRGPVEKALAAYGLKVVSECPTCKHFLSMLEKDVVVCNLKGKPEEMPGAEWCNAHTKQAQ